MKYLFALFLISLAPFCMADTSLWEVSKGGNKLWLGASLGGLKKSAYPLPAEFDDAFRRADKLYVERDIAAINQADFGVRAMQASFYRDGRTLKSVLTPANWQALDAFAQSRGVPVFTLLMFKPAFAGFTLTALETKRLELANGVDAHYFFRAKNNQKPVATLESIDQQIQYLQIINDLEANTLIKIILAELHDLSATIDQATLSWRTGDMGKLDQIKGQKMREHAPDLYQELVVNRNKAWLPQLKTMLDSSEVEYVLVDAMHLAGPNNLLHLLKAEGFTVKPYQL